MFFQISKSLLIYFLHHPDNRIQPHRHDAQQHDGHDQPIHLKEVKGQKDTFAIVLLSRGITARRALFYKGH